VDVGIGSKIEVVRCGEREERVGKRGGKRLYKERKVTIMENAEEEERQRRDEDCRCVE